MAEDGGIRGALRGQSAIEYLTSYAWAFIIIAVTLGVFIYLLAIPQTIIPTSCYFGYGIECRGMVLGSNSVIGGNLIIGMVFTNSQQYDIVGAAPSNLITANFIISQYGTVNAICIPSNAISGGAIGCVGTGTTAVPVGTLLKGTMTVNAAICLVGTANNCKPQNERPTTYVGNFSGYVGGRTSSSVIFTVALYESANSVKAGTPVTLTSVVTMLGFRLESGSVTFATSNTAYATVTPEYSLTGTYGNATSYFNAVANGNYVVTASFAGATATNSILVVGGPSQATTTACVGCTTSTPTTTILVFVRPIYYVPILLSNLQSTATPVNFQQMIPISTSYAAYGEAASSNNIEFSTGPALTGTPLYAWCESGCTSSSSAIWWVNLGAYTMGAAGSGTNTLTIYMNFMSSNVMTSNTAVTGEAPQLFGGSYAQSSYGQYDNGPSVFNFYDDFFGTTLPGKWTSGKSGATSNIVVNNGLAETVPWNAASGAYTYVSTSSYTVTGAQIVESDANLNGFTTSNFRIVPLSMTPYDNAAWGADFELNIGFGWVGDSQAVSTISSATSTTSAFSEFESSQISSSSSYQLFGLTYPNNGLVSVQYNYQNWGSTTSYVPALPLYPTLSYYIQPAQTGYTANYPINAYWVRTRAYPPNGIMPSNSVGSIMSSVTITFSAGNSILQGTSDTATGATTGIGDTVQIKDCVGSGSSCTPSTVLATNAIGSTSVTNNIAFLTPGNFILDACDVTYGICSVTNTVVVTIPVTLLYDVPITISNLQSVATPAPFQQLLNVPSSTYSTYINSQWTNVEFTSGNYAGGSGSTNLQAWVENNAINTAPSTYVWVNLPSGLAAAPGPSNSVTIYMNMMGSNVMSSTGPTGEAPELSSSFGQYDDGSSVFTFYSNAVSTNGYNYVNGIAGDFNVLTQTGPFGASIPTLQLGGAGSGNGESVAWVTSGVAGNGIVEGWINLGTNLNAYFAVRGVSSSGQTNYILGDGWSAAASTGLYMNAGTPGSIFSQGSRAAGWYWASGNFVGSTLSMNIYSQPYGTLQSSASGTDTNLGGGNTYVGLAVWQGSSSPGYFSFWRVRTYPPNGVMPSCSICVSAPPTATLTFSPGNSITQGAADTATGTTSGTGDTIQIKDCVGSGSSCTPSTVLSSGTTTTTNNIAFLPVGNFIFDACDTTQSICSATNTVVVSVSSGVLQYVPIKISNLQISSGTPVPFQQLLNIQSSAYSANINSGWSNVEFTSGNYYGGSGYTAMQAWVENNAINTAAATPVWINIPGGLGAAGGGSNSITVYMNMMTSNVMSSSGPTGEAPQLSTSYGQYDNGASVFTQYGGGGTTAWSQFTYVGGTWNTASGYLQQTSTSGSYSGGPTALIEGASYSVSSSYILESALSYTAQAVARAGIVADATPAGDTNAYRFMDQQSSNGAGFISFLNDNLAWVVSSTYLGAVSTPYTLSIIDSAGTWSGNLYSGYGITSAVLTSLGATAYSAANDGGATTGYVGLSAAVYNSVGTTVNANPISAQWFRMRAYPPNGVMPSCSICVAGVVLPTVTPMVFSPGNSIMQGAFDTVTSTTSGTGDTIAIEDCVGSGTSCTPSTVLATNSVGSNSVTYNLNGMGVGNFIFDACDTTHGVCSATNTVVISNAPTFMCSSNGAIWSNSASAASGCSVYFCNGGYSDGAGQLITSTSWIPSANAMSYASLGSQSSATCSITDSSSGFATMGVVGINEVYPYSIINSPTTFNGAASFSSSYTLSSTSNVLISVACGDYPCSTINVPPGCTAYVQENPIGFWGTGTSDMAICPSQASGTYSVNGVLINTGYTAVVVAQLNQVPTVTLTFTNGNSILRAATDNSVGTTTGIGDIVQLKYCAGSGSSCTPTTVLATNAIGSATVTNSVVYLPVGNYIVAANDITAGVSSATNTVTVVSNTNIYVLTSVTVGSEPSLSAYDSGNGYIYVPNYGGTTVSVINGANNLLAGVVTVGSNPESATYDPGNGYIYVTNSGGSTVSVINGANNLLAGVVTVGSSPWQAAYDPVNGYIYVANNGGSTVSVINGANNLLAASVNVAGFPYSATYDSGNGYLYIPNSATYSVSVINGANNLLAGTVLVGGGPQYATYDPGNGYIYVPSPSGTTVNVINGANDLIAGVVTVGSQPYFSVYDPINGYIYVPNYGGGTVSVINGANNLLAGIVTVGTQPYLATYDPGNGYIYVTNHAASGTVSVINGANDLIAANVPVGAYPEAGVYDPGNGYVYVGDYTASTVSVIT